MDIAKNKIATCLWFDHGQARKAAECYAATFPDSHVGTSHASPSDYPAGKQDDDLMVEFTVLGMPFLGLNAGPNFTFNEAVSFQVYTGARTGSVCPGRSCRARCSTPFAIPTKRAAKRAMAAMMGMKKIDIAAIERARAGEPVA